MTKHGDEPTSRSTVLDINRKIASRLCCIERTVNLAYSRLITGHPWIVVSIVLGFALTTGVCGLALYQLPDFSDPAKGFYADGNDTMTGKMLVFIEIKNRVFNDLGIAQVSAHTNTMPSSEVCSEKGPINNLLHDCALGFNENSALPTTDIIIMMNSSNANKYCAMMLPDLLNLVPTNSIAEQRTGASISNQSQYPLDLRRSYQLYFEPVPKGGISVATLIRSICEYGSDLMAVLGNSSIESEGPRSVATGAARYFNTHCSNLTDEQIDSFVNLLKSCLGLYRTIIPQLVAESALYLQHQQMCQSACFHTSIYESLEYFTVMNASSAWIASIWITPKLEISGAELSLIYESMPFQQSEAQKSAHHQSYVHFTTITKWLKKNSASLKHRILRLTAVNMAHSRLYIAMQQVKNDMYFTALAVFLTLTVSMIYTGNLFICLVTVLNVGLSMSCAYTVYRVILQVELFPYINMAGTFLLIGLSCDNAFVYMDIWRKGENQVHFLTLPGHVVRHATAALFATSATTAAAFFTNMLSRVVYLRFFGLYLGLCIVFLFLFSVTIVPAILVLGRDTNLLSGLLKYKSILKIKTALDKKLISFSNTIFRKLLPFVIIRGRYILTIAFIVFGICGLIAVFVYPRMRAAESIMAQRFFSHHLTENFEFNLKDKIPAYQHYKIKESHNPAIYFVFGVEGRERSSHLQPTFETNAKFFRESRNIEQDPLFTKDNIEWFEKVFITKFLESNLFINGAQIKSDWRLLIGAIGGGDQFESSFSSFMGKRSSDQSSSFTKLFLKFKVWLLPYKHESKILLGGLVFLANANATFGNYDQTFQYISKMESAYANLSATNEILKRGFYVSNALVPFDLQRLVALWLLMEKLST
ncbi:hypothetical protein ACOME3_006477 [Neoechinorhynchus agilis]